MINHDEEASQAILENINATISWLLMAGYQYYVKGDTILSDEKFDWICLHVIANWRKIRHPHKKLISLATLKSGTLFRMQSKDYPEVVKYTSQRLIEDLKDG